MPDDTTPPAPTAPTGPPETPPKTALAASEVEQMMGWLKQDLAQGRISPEQAQKAFDQLNASEEQRGPDARTDEEKLLDKQFPAAKPEDYRITYGGPNEDVPMTPELRQFDQSARTWMSTAGLPRDTGNSLVSAISKVAQQTQHMTADQLEMYGYSEFEKLQKAHGPTLEERLQTAALMIHDLDVKQPGLKNLLKSRGIGDSAMVANMLIAHAQIYHARRGAQRRR